MNQEKIGKLIKQIRKENNLTQAEFAKKYNVTYQAVSKWETGKNIPDIELLNQISKDYNIDIAGILDGKIKKKSNTKKIIVIFSSFLLMVIISFSLYLIFHQDSFEFKTLSAECTDFKITGSIAYSKDKSLIYISSINYCGKDDSDKYKEINCSLYDKKGKVKTKVSDCNNKNNKNITLENYLQNVKFMIDDYESSCKTYDKNTLWIEIIATYKDNKQINYKIPLSLENSCSK